jgi:hypothetical protein
MPVGPGDHAAIRLQLARPRCAYMHFALHPADARQLAARQLGSGLLRGLASALRRTVPVGGRGRMYCGWLGPGGPADDQHP